MVFVIISVFELSENENDYLLSMPAPRPIFPLGPIQPAISQLCTGVSM